MNTMRKFTEDQQYDAQIRKDAYSFAKKIATYIYNLSQDDLDKADTGKYGFFFRIKDIIPLPLFETLYLLLTIKKDPNNKIEGTYIPDFIDGSAIKIPIFYEDPNTHELFMRGDKKNWVYTLMHELLHAIDTERLKNPSQFFSAMKNPTTGEEYFSNPLEFNAYYQMIIKKIDLYLNFIKRKYGMKVYRAELFDYQGLYDLLMDIDNDFYSFMKKASQKYRNKMMKRLYQYYLTKAPKKK
jgi:hypothetical protein